MSHLATQADSGQPVTISNAPSDPASFQAYYADEKVAELRRAFSRVENRADWKGAIAAVVHRQSLAIICEAIEFFTATKATVKPVEGFEATHFYVTSPGYRAGPAA